MRYLYLYVMAGALVGSEAQAAGMQSSVRTTVNDSLPGTVPRQTKGMTYPTPGNAYFNAVQYCGDGDVANFAKGHPDWVHQESGAVDFVVGYWLQQQGSTATDVPILPSGSDPFGNYFAIGFGSLDAGGATVSQMTPANSSDQAIYPTGLPILRTVSSGLALAQSLPSYSMPAAAGTAGEKYNLYFGAMTCHQATGKSSSVKRDPLRVSSALATFAIGGPQLSTSVSTALVPALSQASPPSFSGLNFQASLAGGAGAAAATLVASADGSGSIANATLGSDSLSAIAKKIYELTLPTDTDPIAWAASLKSAVDATQVSALASNLQSQQSCASVSAVHQGAKYAWEPYPLQLTCGVLNTYSGTSLQSYENNFLAQAQTTDAKVFHQRKVPLLTALIAGALIQNLQDAYAATSDPLPRQTCLAASPYINNVMGSMVVQVSSGASQGPAQNPIDLHPEPGFAVGGNNVYYKPGTGDHATIFEMTNPAASGSYAAVLSRGSASAPASLPISITMQFNIRGVGCGKNMYCWNDR